MTGHVHPTAAPNEIGRLLREHYRSVADDRPVSGQLEAIVAGISASRPRPSWVVALRGGTIASGAGRRLAHRQLIGVALIALTAIAVAAAIVVGRSAPTKPADPDGSTFQAVFLSGLDDPEPVREIQVIVTRPDGTERVIARLPSSILPDSMPRPRMGVVSPDGWLALKITGAEGHGWAFIDLHAPDRPPSIVQIPWWGGYPSAALGSWGPAGHFVASASEYHDVMWDFDVASATASPLDGAAQVIQDVTATGDRSPLPSKGRVYWAFGSGFVAWLVPETASGEPRVLYQSLGPRRLRADGEALDVCLPNGPPCVQPDLRPGTIATIRPDGTSAIVDQGRATPGCAVDASFDAGGTSIWVLRQTAGSEAHVIVERLRPAGVVSNRMELAFAGVDVNSSDHSMIVGIAPDDSMIAFSSPVLHGRETLVVPTTDDHLAVFSRSSRFAGFLPSTVADALAGGAFVHPPAAREGLLSVGPLEPGPTASGQPGSPSRLDCGTAPAPDQ